ncbi:MAG: hypothetical protein GY926_09290 [bacterium]|nr:hypothetical protein [bacterium]
MSHFRSSAVWIALAVFAFGMSIDAAAAGTEVVGTTLVSGRDPSVALTGARGPSVQSDVSADGNIIVYRSTATNLVVGDTNRAYDIFLYDVTTDTTTRVSVASDGTQADSSGHEPAVSADGGTVVYQSYATNLVPEYTSGHYSQIYAYDVASGTTTRVSITSDGGEARGGSSSDPAISADGATIVYESRATNLVADDTNGDHDIYAYDVSTGTTTRVSVASDGTQANDDSDYAAISADGSMIVYESAATNLVADDTNGFQDVFAYDVGTGATTLVSVAGDGTQADSPSNYPAVSGDGGTIVYSSGGSNLAAGDTNAASDIFAHDVATGSTTRISVDSDGTQANDSSYVVSISGDGDTVAFLSDASNLVSGDTNHVFDIFVYDVTTATTIRVSVASDGTQANDKSYHPEVSDDGSTVVYSSPAANLVPGDTDGRDIFSFDIASGTTRIISTPIESDTPNGSSFDPAISEDGDTVAYASDATDLIPGDTNMHTDIFAYDVPTGSTTRISVAGDGTQANGISGNPAISGDGSTIVYESYASNLVPGDTNGAFDIFAYDVATGVTTRISVASDGTQANGQSYEPTVSSNGDIVAFSTSSSNLVPADTMGISDVFVHNRSTRVTIRVSVASDGTQANSTSRSPGISGDGNTIVYESQASNLVPGDTNGAFDIFIHDVGTGSTTRVSVASDGTQTDGDSETPAISADGNTIAYESQATNLIGGDVRGQQDIFSYDIRTGTTTRISVANDGAEGNHYSFEPAVSADGNTIAYHSDAYNLVPDDSNGYADVFAYDIATRRTTLISGAPDGTVSNGYSKSPAVSGNGHSIVYRSSATDLVEARDIGLLKIFLTEINRSPHPENSNIAVAEDAAVGTGIGIVSATDPDSDVLQYSIAAGNEGGLFSIDDDGAVTLTGALDYESASEHLLTVSVSDGHLTADATVVIKVTDVNETPVVDDDLAASVAEDAAVGTGIGTVSATDPDSDVLQYSIAAGNEGGLFSIDDDGAVTLTGALDYETSSQHVLAVTVSDGHLSDTARVTVNVTNVDERGDDDPSPGDDPFTDDDGSIFENDIEWLAFAGITQGCNPPVNDLFCPNDFVTRGQMAAFLDRALELPVTSEDFFGDDTGSIFEDAINRLAAAGITMGCNPRDGNTEFCVSGNVTRGQMAAFLVRALGDTDDDRVNLFSDDDGSIFEDAIDKLATAGVTQGCNPPANTEFCPGEDVTRGQMAAFLHRALG